MKEDRSGAGVQLSYFEYVTLSRGQAMLGEAETEAKQGLKKYAQSVSANNRAYYLVEELNEHLQSFASLPLGLRRASLFLRPPVLWTSTMGNTSSVLHNDGEDNINCVLAGEKRIVLMNQSYENHVNNTDQHGGYGTRSTVDVDETDLSQYPRIREVQWNDILLRPGDCVYMPYAWLHAVRSPVGRSLASNVWFNPRKDAFQKPCSAHIREINATDPEEYGTREDSESAEGLWSTKRESDNVKDGSSSSRSSASTTWEALGGPYLSACAQVEAGAESQCRYAKSHAERAVCISNYFGDDRLLPLDSPTWGFISEDLEQQLGASRIALSQHRNALWDIEIDEQVKEGSISPENARDARNKAPWKQGHES